MSQETGVIRFDAVQVERLAGFGMSQEQIADFFGAADRTLRKQLSADPVLRAAYKKGRQVANQTVAEKLFAKAKEGDTTSMIFWLKTRAGWRESGMGYEEIRERLDETIAVIEDMASPEVAQAIKDRMREVWAA